jgi:hypothetical protein
VKEPQLRDLIIRFADVSLDDVEELPAPEPAPTPMALAMQRLTRRVNAFLGPRRRR